MNATPDTGGYYYACLDAKNRLLVAPHFSTKRNVEAATTCILGALKRINNPPHDFIYLVHDHHPAYFLAVQLINQSGKFKFRLKSLPVKGLKDLPDADPNPYRAYKNIIERYFGKAKPVYYLTRGFGSVKGAITHNILYAIDYNYFHPHEVFDYQPPMKTEGLRSEHPIEKWNKLIGMAMEIKDT